MAEIDAVEEQLGSSDDRVMVTTWSDITNADTCQAVRHVSVAYRCVQVAGTFGSATVVFHGSNDGTNYVVLKDIWGNAISVTSAAIKQIGEIPLHFKPVISGGGGTQDLEITLVERRGFR